ASRVPRNVRLHVRLKMDLQHSVRALKRRDDRRCRVINEHEGPLERLRVAALWACAIVPQPQSLKPVDVTVIPTQSDPFGVELHPCERTCGLEPCEIRHGRFTCRECFSAHL